MEIYPDYTVFIQVANFLFLLLILNIILYRPIRKILDQRKKEMNSFQTMIEDFQDKSAQYENDLEENRTEARKEGYKEKEDLKNACLREEKDLLQEATSLADEKMGQAKEEIERKRKDARRSLENEVEVFSHELAEKVLGRSL